MLVKEFSKAHGPTIAGIGCLVLAASVFYAGHGICKRYDEAKPLLDNAKTVIMEAQSLEKQTKSDLAAFREKYPEVSQETAKVTAKAVNTFEEWREKRKVQQAP